MAKEELLGREAEFSHMNSEAVSHVLGGFEDICESDLLVIIQRKLKVVMGAVFLQAFGEHPGERRNLCSLVSRELRNSVMQRKSYVWPEQFVLAGGETEEGKRVCAFTLFRLRVCVFNVS